MKKVFSERNIHAKGNILPQKDFKLFCELDSYSFNERKAKEAIREAEESLKKEIPLLPLSLYFDFFRTGNRKNFETKYQARRGMCLSLALGEYFERKGRFTEKLVDVIWAILEESTWVIPAHLQNSPYGADRNIPPVYQPNVLHCTELLSAGTCAIMATVLYLCRDILDAVNPLIAEKMEYITLERCIPPYLHGNYLWMGFSQERRVNNWGPWVSSLTLYVTALLEKNPITREAVAQKVMLVLDNYTNCLPDDGGCDEGPAYWSGAGGSYFDALEILYDMSGGKINVYDSPFIKSIGEYIINVNVDGKRFVNFSDAGATACPDGNLLRRFGEKCGSSELAAFGDTMATINDINISGTFCYRILRCLISEDVKETKVKGKLKSFMPALKVMTARESEDTSKGVFLGAKGGNNGESHNHNDVGSFVIYKNGKPVIVDAGNETYTKKTFSAERYTIWCTQSLYHNLPAFDGVGQENGKQYCSCCEKYEETADGAKYTVQLKDAYPESIGIRSYLRCSELKGDTVSINDTVSLNKKKEIDFRFLTCEKPKIMENGRITLAENMNLSYDASVFTAEVEMLTLVDETMLKRWERGLYLIHLKAEAKEISAEFIFN